MTRRLVGGLLLFALCGTSSASATTIISTLPEFTGDVHDVDESFPLAPVVIGTFAYDIPHGETVVGGSLTGTYGNSDGGNTAPMQLLFDDLLVSSCSPGGACQELPQEAVSFNFAKVSIEYLQRESNTLRTVQTGPGAARLGEWTLTIDTVVPEPSTAVLLGGWLAPLLGLARRGCPKPARRVTSI